MDQTMLDLEAAAEKKYNRAVLHMFYKQAGFIANVLCQLKRMWDHSIPTAATNGTTLFINPEFFLNLTDGQRVTLLAHESWHVGYDHMGRMTNRDGTDWNNAADYAINQDLKDSGYEPIDGWLQNDQYRDLSAEEIYSKISNGQQPQPQNPMGGDVMVPDPNAPNQVREVLSRAATMSKFDGSWGTVPGTLRDMIDALVNPVLPWETLLERYLDQIFSREQSWARRNRMYRDIVAPGWAQQDSLGANNIVWNFDVSGSVTDEQVQRFITEVAHVHNTYECERTIINTFDTCVQGTYQFGSDDKIEEIEVNGRGGTDLFPAIEEAKKQRPRVLIVFSDLECQRYPAKLRPDFPVVWLCCDNPNATVEFGHIIHFSTTTS